VSTPANKLRWIQTGGGPFILLPAAVRKHWQGFRATTADQPTDYDRACAVPDELGELEVGAATGLVLGDEPHQTACYQEGDLTLLVRWVAAPSANAVLVALHDAARLEYGEPVARYTALGGDQLLIDAAEPGDDVRGDVLTVELSPGRYIVDTAHFNSGSDLRLVLHRFRSMP
jgi:hypothetical protein